MVQYLQALLVSRYARSDRGASAVEYGLLVALIALALIVGAGLLGDGLNQIFSDSADKLDEATTPTTP
ncbi:Flp family type IVb pilin [Nocardioides sp. YIM 152588]|uniref:Flp family type IVb pilin n=1 Tax=Nocardioides sp. YIM 152588 TaxID=3158259 RepID=UPI0032E51988